MRQEKAASNFLPPSRQSGRPSESDQKSSSNVPDAAPVKLSDEAKQVMYQKQNEIGDHFTKLISGGFKQANANQQAKKRVELTEQ